MKVYDLRAFRTALLGLPVVVARARLFVAISARWYAQAFRATLQAKEHTRLLVRCGRASIRTFRLAICFYIHTKDHVLLGSVSKTCKKATAQIICCSKKFLKWESPKKCIKKQWHEKYTCWLKSIVALSKRLTQIRKYPKEKKRRN